MSFTPGTYAWRMARADVAPLGIIPRGRNVESGEVVTLPYGPQVLSWSIGLPGGLSKKTTEPGGGLTTDADGVIRFPLAPADLASAAVHAVMPVVVRIEEDGAPGTTIILGTLELLD